MSIHSLSCFLVDLQASESEVQMLKHLLILGSVQNLQANQLAIPLLKGVLSKDFNTVKCTANKLRCIRHLSTSDSGTKCLHLSGSEIPMMSIVWWNHVIFAHLNGDLKILL